MKIRDKLIKWLKKKLNIISPSLVSIRDDETMEYLYNNHWELTKRFFEDVERIRQELIALAPPEDELPEGFYD